jgi:hypothetical protein
MKRGDIRKSAYPTGIYLQIRRQPFEYTHGAVTAASGKDCPDRRVLQRRDKIGCPSLIGSCQITRAATERVVMGNGRTRSLQPPQAFAKTVRIDGAGDVNHPQLLFGGP